MLLNKNINPALEGASSGSSGPNTATSHNCQCSTDQQQRQPQLYQHQQKQQLQQRHNRSNVSPSCCNPALTDHLNEKYIKHGAHSETTLNHSSDQPTLVKHTSSNNHNNTTSNGGPHYKAFKRSHKQLQLESQHHHHHQLQQQQQQQQQQQYQQTAAITTNNQDLHGVYQPQSSSSLQLLDLQLPARNPLKRKNICEQEIGEEGNTSASGTIARLNNDTNEELDDELNFDYEPVLTKILDEKKLVSMREGEKKNNYMKDKRTFSMLPI